jgi:hypothetical protein
MFVALRGERQVGRARVLSVNLCVDVRSIVDNYRSDGDLNMIFVELRRRLG